MTKLNNVARNDRNIKAFIFDKQRVEQPVFKGRATKRGLELNVKLPQGLEGYVDKFSSVVSSLLAALLKHHEINKHFL